MDLQSAYCVGPSIRADISTAKDTTKSGAKHVADYRMRTPDAPRVRDYGSSRQDQIGNRVLAEDIVRSPLTNPVREIMTA